MYVYTCQISYSNNKCIDNVANKNVFYKAIRSQYLHRELR